MFTKISHTTGADTEIDWIAYMQQVQQFVKVMLLPQSQQALHTVMP